MKKLRLLLPILLIVFVGLLTLRPALAHEDRKAGPYNLHVGWNVEPALVDQLNAVQLTVTQDNKPVANVEKTLTMTISTRGITSDKMNS